MSGDDEGSRRLSPPKLGEPPNIGGAIMRGAFSQVPVLGPIFVELVNEFIPEQRWEKLQDYLSRLHDRLASIEEGELRQRLHQPENIELLETGGRQAVRALSGDRRQYIADLVAAGIGGDEAARLQAKRLLHLLGEIDDDQLIILTGELQRHQNDQEFYDRHRAVLEPKATHVGLGQDEVDEATLHEQARAHLIRLGLLTPRFQKPKRGELPEFDERTGMMKVSWIELSPIGRMLLREVGLAGPDDF